MIPEWATPLVHDVVQAAVVFVLAALVTVATILWDVTRKNPTERPRKGCMFGPEKGGG
jgi:hypothetical protein